MTTKTIRTQDSRLLGQVIAKALNDDAYKRRLLAETETVLREGGVSIPEGMQVRAVEDTEKLTHLVIPVRPKVSKKMDDGDLATLISSCNCWQGEGWN